MNISTEVLLPLSMILSNVIIGTVAFYAGVLKSRETITSGGPVLSPPRNLSPFSKPSGKRKPKINDDFAAWKNENDR